MGGEKCGGTSSMLGGGGDAFVFKIFWRGSNKGRGERGQEGGGEMRWLEVGGGGGGG